MTKEEVFEQLTPDDVRIIVAYANSNMNVSGAAKESFFTWDAVKYHLNKIYRKTQLDPHNFYDLTTLIEVIRYAADP